MTLDNKYLPAFFILLFSLNCYSQEILFSAGDTLKSYYIVTLNDGTVLKGKIINQERRMILFQDEMLGNITFRTKDVSSMEKLQPQDYYLITMMNGTTLQGKITNRIEKEIFLETENIGNITVDVSKIKTIKVIQPGNMKDGKYWFSSAITNHYFFMPSSIPLKKGESFYQSSDILFNSFQIGISKNFSFNGGVIIPLAAFVSPNFMFRINDWLHAGAGAAVATITDSYPVWMGFTQCTFGKRNAHISLGWGYGFTTVKRYYYVNKTTKVEVGLVALSGMKRISPRYALVTENWFTPNEGIKVFSGGLRLMGEKNTWDFGIASISVSRKFAGTNVTVGPLTLLSYMRNL